MDIFQTLMYEITNDNEDNECLSDTLRTPPQSDNEQAGTNGHKSTIIDENVDVEFSKPIGGYDLKLGIKFVDDKNLGNTLSNTIFNTYMKWIIKGRMTQI